MTRPSLTARIKIGDARLYLVLVLDGNGNIAELVLPVAQCVGAELELICKLANLALKHGAGIDAVMGLFRGTRFEPAGACPTVEGIVSSPADAVAKVIERWQAVKP